MSLISFEKQLSYKPELRDKGFQVYNFFVDLKIGSLRTSRSISSQTGISLFLVESFLESLANDGFLEKVRFPANQDCERFECQNNFLAKMGDSFFCDICEGEIRYPNVKSSVFFKVTKSFILKEDFIMETSTRTSFLRRGVQPISYETDSKDFFIQQSHFSGNDVDAVLRNVEKYGICWFRLQGQSPSEKIVDHISKSIGLSTQVQNDFNGKVKLIKPTSDGPENSGSTANSLGAHVDGTQHAGTPSLLIFAYEDQADLGARSEFYDLSYVLNQMSQKVRNRLIETLSHPNCAIFEKKNMKYTGPIFTISDSGTLAIRCRFDSVISVKPECQKSFDLLSQMIQDHKSKIMFMPVRGDVVIFDNWRLMHGRSEVISNNQRSHYRVWLENIHRSHQAILNPGIKTADIELLSTVQKLNGSMQM